MRTGRLLTVSQHTLPRECVCPEGGVSAVGAGGVAQHAADTPPSPVDRQTPVKTSFAGGKNILGYKAPLNTWSEMFADKKALQSNAYCPLTDNPRSTTNKFQHVWRRGPVQWGPSPLPPCEQTDTHSWKYYLHATLLATSIPFPYQK